MTFLRNGVNNDTEGSTKAYQGLSNDPWKQIMVTTENRTQKYY